ncbi:MAG: alternate-type signal peptide domain-containing protein [Terrimesophilobacter sp.]
MNKLTKAAIAGAAGIALLLGGAGSLAYWNDSAAVSGSTISSGTLAIDLDGTATKTYTGTNDAVSLIVPGDSVTIEQMITIDASGDNLSATLELDEAALTGDLKDYVTVSFKAFAGAVEVTGLTNLTAAEAGAIDKVVVTVVFDSATENKDGQDSALDLGELVLKLTQNS